MTASDRHSVGTIRLPAGSGITSLTSVDGGRAAESGPALGGLIQEQEACGPRIRAAVYESEFSAADRHVDCPSFDRGPIVEDLRPDPVASAAAQLIMRLVIEVLARRRPATQLGDFVTPSVARCVRVAAAKATPVRMSSLHVQQPHADAVEACVVCRTDDGHRALVARIDRGGRREWCCTAFRFL
jgi:hypothetical protein